MKYIDKYIAKGLKKQTNRHNNEYNKRDKDIFRCIQKRNFDRPDEWDQLKAN